MFSPQKLHKLLSGITLAPKSEVQRLGNRWHDEFSRSQGLKGDKADAFHTPPSRFESEPGFSDTTGANQRQQMAVRVSQAGQNFRQFVRPADKRSGRYSEVIIDHWLQAYGRSGSCGCTRGRAPEHSPALAEQEYPPPAPVRLRALARSHRAAQS